MIIGLKGKSKSYKINIINLMVKEYNYNFIDLEKIIINILKSKPNFDISNFEMVVQVQNEINLQIAKELNANSNIVIDAEYLNNSYIKELFTAVIECTDTKIEKSDYEDLWFLTDNESDNLSSHLEIVDCENWESELEQYIKFNLNNDILVSVIVPIYNVSEYLVKCVNSIRTQSYRNLEIILINDGSIDNSLQICERLSKLDNRIKLINQNNKGLAETRNVGIENSSGEYITFIDSDDFIENDMVSTLLANALEYNADVSHGRAILHTRNGRIFGVKEKEKEVIYLENQEEILDAYTKGQISIAAWDKLYKKSSLEGIRFDKDTFKEDVDFIFQLCMSGKIFICDTGKYYHYVKRPMNSLTAKFSEEMFTLMDWGKYAQSKVISEMGENNKLFADKFLHFCLANILRLFARDFKAGKILTDEYNDRIQKVVNEFTNVLFNASDITKFDDLDNLLGIINLLLENKVIDKEKMPSIDVECIGILWNTMSGDLIKEAVNIISGSSEFIDYQVFNISEYEKFIREIYLHNHEVEGVAYMKASTLVDKYDSNEIVILNAIFKVRNFLYLNAKKGYAYRELAELKKQIRRTFKDRVRDYTYDTVFHLTMDQEEYEFTDAVVRKYCKDYKGLKNEQNKDKR